MYMLAHQTPVQAKALKSCCSTVSAGFALQRVRRRLTSEDVVGGREGPHVAGPAVGGGVAEAHAEGAAGVVGRQLEPLDVRGELGPALERGEVAGAERQLGAPALAPRDHPGRREVAGRVAEGEAVVGDAPLAQVHREGHDGACRHRVQPELVAGLVESGDGGQIADAAVGAAEAEGLELRTFTDVVAEPVDLTTREWTLRAGADLGAHLQESCGVDPVGLLRTARSASCAWVARRRR